MSDLSIGRKDGQTFATGEETLVDRRPPPDILTGPEKVRRSRFW